MDIKIGDRVFQLTDSCPTDAPKKRRLIRHLRDHGPESLLSSKTLAPFAQCVLAEILVAGGQPVDVAEEPRAGEAGPETEISHGDDES